MRLAPLAALAALAMATPAAFAAPPAPEAIRLATNPALSPDGSTLVFAWAGDLWTVPVAGGTARPMTRHPGRDREPSFSPDGKQVAFVSNRSGGDQVYVMPAEGGMPRQVTYHTAGQSLEGWSPDGQSLLTLAARDHHWRDARRFFRVGLERRGAEELLFDDYGEDGDLAPDGKRLLFTRETLEWWRKGYRGSRAAQVWMFDRDSKAFTKVHDPDTGARWPLWRPDGKGFYYVGLHNGALNLRERELDSGKDRPLTEFNDDSVVFPCLSRDGSTIVFRHLFDLYRFYPAKGGAPERIAIVRDGDDVRDPVERRVVDQARQVAFSRDGLELAFVAGGDVWVMDTLLLEPRQVTDTPEEERDVTFSPEGDALLFVSDRDGQGDIWRAGREDAALDWWQNPRFKLDRLTHDADVESDLRWSPDGARVAFVKGRGDLWVIDRGGKEARRLFESWDKPEYDWSPDGAWIVYARADEDFNHDVWLIPVDGSRPPFNLSRHPDNESNPTWSPDGKLIAFTGRRIEDEVDIYYLWLRAEDDETTRRERTIEKAVEKIKQARKKAARSRPGPEVPGDDNRDKGKSGPESSTPQAEGDEEKADEPKPAPKPKEPPRVVIDFDGIHDRLHHVAIPDTTETGLFWSPDSKKLAFSATVEGKSGVFTIEVLDDPKPKPLTTQSIRQARWLEAGNQVVGLIDGVPASLAAASGKETKYAFRALQAVNLPEKFRAAFDLCWRTMRDHYYDERLGNRNWDAVRRKYGDVAAGMPDVDTFAIVVDLMLGELNGSHLGFTPDRDAPGPAPGPARRGGPGRSAASGRWEVVTAHLGVRFEDGYKGPGLKVRDVIPEGPADRKKSRVEPGEVVLAIDGVSVDPAMDLTEVLNGPLERDIRLTVRGAGAGDGGKDARREVTVRPIPYPQAQTMLYEKWVEDNRKKVERASNGTLGYLHIRGMNLVSFYKFEEELYSAGSGKDGLIVDVRHNGGGSTTDHLLTVLTAPVHAITVPRGGGPGYPHDRRVYATWTRPILVLCNQNSFSNAEIFSHAIKTLKRGKLVGVPTAGGVISTGATPILDLGTLRLPGRGWFVLGTGEDMELNGAVPDHVIWPLPGEFARGVDTQLDKAVEVLRDDVKDAKQRPQPRLRKASER